MRTLVVNLTRFGDLLQTQPVLSGLKARGHTVGLVCLQNFRGATSLLRHVDAVFDIPGARLLAELDGGWPEAVGDFLAWTGQVRSEFSPQSVINLTPSLTGRLLARALSDGDITGFGVDRHGFGTYSSPWPAFLEASSRQRGCNAFNLVDLFWKSAHLGDGPRPFRLADPALSDVESARALLAAQAEPGYSGFVGMQLGASEARRQWPVESFAALAEGLWERWRLVPVLLGGKGEEPLGDGWRAACRVPHVDCIGRTGMNELAAVVKELRLLVSNDTGTMHLAAGLDIPILAIFLATAQPWDTGPYRQGCLCLEADIPCHPCGFGQPCTLGEACRTEISAPAALAFVEGFLRDGVWPELLGLNVRAWETVTEPDGYYGLRSRSGHGATDRAVWNAIQRQAWRRFLDGEPVSLPSTLGEGLSEEFRQDLLPVLHQASGFLAVLVQQAGVLKVVNRPVMRTKFMATWQRLETLFSSCPGLGALGRLWLHLSQQRAEDLENLLQLAARVDELVSCLTLLLSEGRRP